MVGLAALQAGCPNLSQRAGLANHPPDRPDNGENSDSSKPKKTETRCLHGMDMTSSLRDCLAASTMRHAHRDPATIVERPGRYGADYSHTPLHRSAPRSRLAMASSKRARENKRIQVRLKDQSA